jgi:hypothetical protein
MQEGVNWQCSDAHAHIRMNLGPNSVFNTLTEMPLSSYIHKMRIYIRRRRQTHAFRNFLINFYNFENKYKLLYVTY